LKPGTRRKREGREEGKEEMGRNPPGIVHKMNKPRRGWEGKYGEGRNGTHCGHR